MDIALRARAPLFSAHDFRAALGHFATGVTVVTCRDADHGLVGLTASSFNSVSLDPPLVLWSLAHRAASMVPLKRGTHYAINVLASHQQVVAERFAARNVDRFAGTAWHVGRCGAPVLDGAAAVFECYNRSRYEEGDHTIFVGEVERFDQCAEARPLLFHRGRFVTSLTP